MRSFPRARVEALRRKHHARLLAAEGPASPQHAGPGVGLGGGLKRDVDSREMDEEDSSDAEGDEGDGEWADANGEYDVVSLDDLETPARSFWL